MSKNNKYWFINAGMTFNPVTTSSNTPIDPEPVRVTFSDTAHVVADGHSFLAFSFGYTGDNRGSLTLPNHWQGDIDYNYAGYSSLEQRWNLNGPSRTEPSYDVLWTTEFANPSGGFWPDPNANTLQYLYWYVLTAQEKNAQAVFLLPPWSPQGMDIDAQVMSAFQYYVDWVKSKPGVTIDIFIIPAPIIVRQWISDFGNVWDDGLHLAHDDPSGPTGYNSFLCGAMGIAFKMMMTGELESDSAWSNEMNSAVVSAWTFIQDYACTGFGGTVTVFPWSGADPLPSPNPLP